MAKTTITGSIQDIKDVESKEHNDKVYYTRRMIVTEVEVEYPQTYMIEFAGPTLCDSLERYRIGEVVTCECNLNGKPYQDKNTGEAKVFQSIRCWKITSVSAPYSQATSVPPSQPAINPPADDDLPF